MSGVDGPNAPNRSQTEQARSSASPSSRLKGAPPARPGAEHVGAKRGIQPRQTRKAERALPQPRCGCARPRSAQTIRRLFSLPSIVNPASGDSRCFRRPCMPLRDGGYTVVAKVPTRGPGAAPWPRSAIRPAGEGRNSPASASTRNRAGDHDHNRPAAIDRVVMPSGSPARRQLGGDQVGGHVLIIRLLRAEPGAMVGMSR